MNNLKDLVQAQATAMATLYSLYDKGIEDDSPLLGVMAETLEVIQYNINVFAGPKND